MFQNIILIGNLGSKPEMRYTPGGKAVASFSLAVSERKDETVWFRVSCWEKTAENVSQYLDKGSKVMVSGKMQEARAFTDKQGNQRASLEVTAREVKFLSGGKDSEATGQNVATEDVEAIPF